MHLCQFALRDERLGLPVAPFGGSGNMKLVGMMSIKSERGRGNRGNNGNKDNRGNTSTTSTTITRYIENYYF